jgi:hypothetical protein
VPNRNVNVRLDSKGLVAFDARNETDRTKAVARTIAVSLDLLDEARQVRFGELGVFPEDADVPVGIVARFWAETGGLEASETEDFLNELSDLSLLLHLDLDRRTLRLHDTIRHFLPMTLIFRTPISTAFCGSSSGKRRKTCSRSSPISSHG